MLTEISAFYGVGAAEIMEWTVGLRRRYYEEIPRHQAARNMHLAGVVLLPHAGEAGRVLLRQWQGQVDRPRAPRPGPTEFYARIEWLREEHAAGRMPGDAALTRRGIEDLQRLVGMFEQGPAVRDAERYARATERMVKADG